MQSAISFRVSWLGFIGALALGVGMEDAPEFMWRSMRETRLASLLHRFGHSLLQLFARLLIVSTISQ